MSWIGINWTFNSGYIYRTGTGTSGNYVKLNLSEFSFDSKKTYIYKTKIYKLEDLTNADNFRSRTPWNDTFSASFVTPSSDFNTPDGFIYHISTPNNNIVTSDWITYYANNSLTGRGIMNTDVKEIDWRMNGISWINDDDGTADYISNIASRSVSTNKDLVCSGWNYDSFSEKYYYYDSGTESSFYPYGGPNNSKSENYKVINYIYKYIDYNFFNLHFNFYKEGHADFGMKIYLSSQLPYNGTDLSLFSDYINNNCTRINSYTTDGIQSSYYGLSGYKYILFVADNVDIDDEFTLISIGDIKIEGNYYTTNNEILEFQGTLFPLNFYPDVPLTGATYTYITGTGFILTDISTSTVIEDTTVLNELNSRIGNGKFEAGKWENGVWNNGWREDTNVHEFYDIDLYIKTLSDVKWVVRLVGPTQSINAFDVGDEISIGNIIGIDINENRKLLKDTYRVLSKTLYDDNRTGNILIELETTFPLRRIQRDSINHKIYVTKNIWKSGVFLNGYFSGIWNYGLFKGYPQITEMYETQWIDGIFQGGHFNSDYYISGSFSNTFYVDGNYLGLSFSTAHNLAVGDKIIIDKDDKLTNAYYDGEHTVLEIIDNYKISVDLEIGESVIDESGSYTTPYKNSLMQNVKFDSENISDVTSINSLVSTEVFIYNSWLDIVYDNSSSVNIGKKQTKLNTISNKYYSENNLYGYPTNDVLSSISIFRDSYSLNETSYKLGVKYKIFNDYIGDSGIFSDYFDNNNLDLFTQKGWTISSATTSYYSRTVDDGTSNIEGEELNIKTSELGTYLDIAIPSVNVPNRVNDTISKNRYSIIEFDLITYSATYSLYYYTTGESAEPVINLNNINKISRIGYTYSIDATYLPIYENINHMTTSGTKKTEYFYNKQNLSLNVRGNGINGEFDTDVTINNLKLYETDMIPFFKYYKDENINNSVQIPYQAIAPYIDYKNADFNYIDNISIGLDSVIVQSTTELVSGTGDSISDPDVDYITGISRFENRSR